MKRKQQHHGAPWRNAVDRLAANYQQARRHKRRMHRCVSLAVAAGDIPAVRAALSRYRAALAWEERTRRRYERAALLEYTAWTRAAPASAGQTTARTASAA